MEALTVETGDLANASALFILIRYSNIGKGGRENEEGDHSCPRRFVAFTLGVIGGAFAGEIVGKITKIEHLKGREPVTYQVTIEDASGNQKTVEVTDVKVHRLKVGSAVKIIETPGKETQIESYKIR